jgi:hypothetical protein
MWLAGRSQENPLYKAKSDNHFSPVNIQLPLQRVNAVLVDDHEYLFATFGGGLFRVTN